VGAGLADRPDDSRRCFEPDFFHVLHRKMIWLAGLPMIFGQIFSSISENVNCTSPSAQI